MLGHNYMPLLYVPKEAHAPTLVDAPFQCISFNKVKGITSFLFSIA